MNDIVYVILAVVLVVIIIILTIYNKLIKLKNNVKKAKANIEIYLNKRFDLIPNIVECVKSYSKYENETLESIVSLRSNYTEQKSINIKTAENMNNSLNKLLAIVENYPELKANANYMNLHNELRNIEDELEISRTKYNDVVTKYNTKVETIPSNLVASIFGFKKAELFKTEDSKKENIQVNL